MATQRLGKYEILEELGSGGFATVFRARDTTLRRDVALKILHQALVADPDFVRRFENDARAAANLEHPRIITVHEMGQLEQRFYIAMQYLPGGSLADRIKREEPFSFEEAVAIIQQVAEALAYAHQKGFVHRDVKPTNVLFDAQGEAVVSDFGLVKAAESSIVARSTAGGIVGTPAYIAPEAWEERDVSSVTDVYALGCVFFEMLTGERLFKGETSPAVMMAHFKPPEYPEQWPEGVPPEVRSVLEKALARDPGERYASARAFAADLQGLAEQAADPLAEPYEGLKVALAGERWDFALRRADEIMAQETGYRDVQALRKRAVEGKAEAERAQWAAQWCEQALEAERRGDMEAARVAARRWLEMAPGDAEAEALLERLKSAAQESSPSPETETKPKQPPSVSPVPQDSEPQPPSDRTTRTEPSEKSGVSNVPIWAWALGVSGEPKPEVVEVEKLVTVEKFVTVTPAPLPPTATPKALQLPPADASLSDTWTRPADDAVMVYVPAGEFEMGSNKGRGDEQPVHTVALDGFWIDKHEMTNAQFAAFLNEEGNRREGGTTWLELDSDYCLIEESGREFQPKSGYADHPVVKVSWYGARAYAEWVGGQLPSEAEWEYAARGPDGSVYPWGDDEPTCDLAQYGDCSGRTVPVGSFPDGASWCGTLDMAGNVWEWTRSLYGGYPYDPGDGREDLEASGPRVLRGGAFSVSADDVRCATRVRLYPFTLWYYLGFRVCVVSQQD